MAYSVSIIVPTYFRYDCLERLLDNLSKQTYPLHEVVIADQTPVAERPGQFYEKFSFLPLRIIDLEEPSLTTSRNAAARQATGDLILFIDDDMVPQPGLVEAHVQAFHEERVDVVFGAVSNDSHLAKEFTRNLKRLDPISYFLKSPKKQWGGMILIITGANTLMRRSLFLEVGGFDHFMPRMEDIELGYRLFRHGAKMYYSSKAFAQHKEWSTGGTRKSQKNLPYVRLVSRLYLYKKHFPGWATKQFILREFCSAFLFRDYVSGKTRSKFFLQPYLPIVRSLKIMQAISEAQDLLDRRNDWASQQSNTHQEIG